MSDRVPRQLWLLVATVAGLRCLVAIVLGFDVQRLLEPDSSSYLEPARALMHDFAFYSAPGSHSPEFLRTPGYPAVLALLLTVTGGSVRAVAALQGLISAITLVPAFLLARRLFDARVAWATVALLAIDPLSLWYSTLILTETFTATILTTLSWLIVRAIQDNRRRWTTWSLIGTLSAVAAHFRPSQYYFVALLLLVVVVVGVRRKWTRRAVALSVAAVLLPFVLIVGGWQLRNQAEVGSARFSGIEAVNMYLYRGAGVIALRDDRNWLDVQAELDHDFPPRRADEAVGSYYDRMYSAGVEIVTSEPVLVLVMTGQGLWRSAIGFPVRMDAFLERWNLPDLAALRLAIQYAMVPVWMLVTAGLIRARRQRVGMLAHWTVLGILAFVLLIAAGPEAYSRFRVPVMPLIFMYAAAGAVPVVDRLAARLQWRRPLQPPAA